MQSPDTNTWLILLLNLCGYVVLWFRKYGVVEFQHDKMWKWYEEVHGINGHGKKHAPAKEG